MSATEKKLAQVAHIQMTDKGRLTIPAEIRKSAGLAEGELVVRAVGDGMVVLETRESVIRRIRDGVPDAPSGGWPIEAWDRADMEEA